MVPPLGDSGWIFSLPSLVGFKSQGSSFLFSSLPASQAKAGHSKYRGRFEGPVKCCNILPQLKSDGNTLWEHPLNSRGAWGGLALPAFRNAQGAIPLSTWLRSWGVPRPLPEMLPLSWHHPGPAPARWAPAFPKLSWHGWSWSCPHVGTPRKVGQHRGKTPEEGSQCVLRLLIINPIKAEA